jgi:hypothetical protein
MISLAEALREDRLEEFIRQQEAAGVGPVDAIDAALQDRKEILGGVDVHEAAKASVLVSGMVHGAGRPFAAEAGIRSSPF